MCPLRIRFNSAQASWKYMRIRLRFDYTAHSRWLILTQKDVRLPVNTVFSFSVFCVNNPCLKQRLRSPRCTQVHFIFPLALKSVSITYFMCAHEPIYYKRMQQNTLNMHQINHKENWIALFKKSHAVCVCVYIEEVAAECLLGQQMASSCL